MADKQKMMDGKKIQRYHLKIFGGKRQTAISVAVAAIAAQFGLAATRAAVLVHIASTRPTKAKVIRKPVLSPPPVATGAEFYDTWAWKEARYEAIKRHGRTCQCCGWKPSDGGSYLVVDHIKPRRFFPALELDQDNLQVLCNDCNKGKSYKHHDDFR